MTSIAIEDRGEPGLISRAKRLVKRAVRLTGYDISRIDPDRSLDEFLRMLFAHYDINCVLDVGANEGQYARGLRAIGYRGHIVSFEPLAEPFERLRRRCERDPRWSAHRLALGSREESAPMNVNARSEWSSFHEPLLTSMPDHSADQRGVLPQPRGDRVRLLGGASPVSASVPTGVGLLAAFWRGVFGGLRQPLDRRRRLYRVRDA